MDAVLLDIGSSDTRTDLKPGQFGKSYQIDPVPYRLCGGKIVVWPKTPEDEAAAIHVRLYGLSVKRFETAIATIMLKENCGVEYLLFWADHCRPKKRSRK
jgi:hypothetical protein